jgi:DNA-binding PadR family transcriptional regulator
MRPGIRTTRNLVAMAVLAVLCEQPRHPYEMQRIMRERHKDYASGRSRALYHAVDRLVQEGLIEPVETSREGKRPERTVYRITDEGREEFQAWVTDLLEEPAEDEFPVFRVAASFMGYLDPAAVVDALNGRAERLDAWLRVQEAIIRALRDLGLTRTMLIENEHQRALVQAELGWVRSVVEDIESGALAWDPVAVPIDLDPRVVAELEAKHVI